MSCGIGHRCGLDPLLLWLWHRLVATDLIRRLAWEHPYAVGAALKIKKKKKYGKIISARLLKTRFSSGYDCSGQAVWMNCFQPLTIDSSPGSPPMVPPPPSSGDRTPKAISWSSALDVSAGSDAHSHPIPDLVPCPDKRSHSSSVSFSMSSSHSPSLVPTPALPPQATNSAISSPLHLGPHHDPHANPQ